MDGDSAGGTDRQHTTRLTEMELSGLIHELRQQRARSRADHYAAQLEGVTAALDRGDVEAALNAAKTALRIDFVRWEAHRLLGLVLERTGDRQGAFQSYVTARHLGWESAEAVEAVRRVS